MKRISLYLFMSVVIGSFSCAPKYIASFGPSQKFYDADNSSKQLVADNEKVDAEKQDNESVSVVSNSTDIKETTTTHAEVYDQSLTASKKETTSFYETPKVKGLLKKYEAAESEIRQSDMTTKEQSRAIKKEKRQLGREVKKEIKKEIKEIRKSSDDGEYVIMMILAIIIPPLGVGLTYGITSEFWISLLLTIILWLPGAIYSVIKVHQRYKG